MKKTCFYQPWFYGNWDGHHVVFACDEYCRKTLVLRLPFTTYAVVFPISRVGALYDPEDCPDENFERWMRAYWRKQ